MKIFLMISTQHSVEYTRVALESFRKTTTLRSKDRFLLIDNDGSFESDSDSWFEYHRNKAPQSFAQNANFGLTLALPERADLYLLNNDLLFVDGWLEPLLNPERALLSPFSNREVTLSSNGFTWKNVLSLDEVKPHLDQLSTLVKHHKRLHFGPHTVVSLPFFCVKLPYIAYSEIGLFDESYGVGGGEDYDYCLRAAWRDIPVKYMSQSFVLHFNGKSTWHGIDKAPKTSARVHQYSAHFEIRWGAPLRKLLIDEDPGVLDIFPAAKKLLTEGKLKEALSLLKDSA